MNKLITTEEFVEKNILDEEVMKLPFDEFLIKIYNLLGSESYGNAWVKKLMIDTIGLRQVKASDDRGDCKFYDDLRGIEDFYEMKISYMNKNNKYRLANLRFYQDFDYFLFCFVNTYKKEYGIYLIRKTDLEKCNYLKLSPMNGTIVSNRDNQNVSMSGTINECDVEWLFGDMNQLEGTSYDSLLQFFEKRKKVHTFTNELLMGYTTHQNEVKKTNRNKSERLKFIVKFNNETYEIKGKTNKEVWLNFVKFIGPEILDGLIYPSILGKGPKGYRNKSIGDGYYFNDMISIRETRVNIHNINKKQSSFTVNIFNSITNEQIL